VAPACDKDIGGLDVAMDDALLVRRVERLGNLHTQVEHLVQVHGFVPDQMLQGLAVQKLHDDEGMAVMLADFVNCADAGMVERRSGARFALEPLERLTVLGRLLGQELQRHRTAQAEVFGLVHHTHATATQFL